MCKECGCNKTMVGKPAPVLTGRPTDGPNGYKGQGASPVKIHKGSKGK